jgi:hypothetical protein
MKRHHHVMILSTMFSVSIIALFGNPAYANHATLQIVNNSSFPIVRFYASPYWYKRYGSDLLGDQVIYPGQQWSVDLSDGETQNCIYNTKTILKNGQVFEGEMNVCTRQLIISDR